MNTPHIRFLVIYPMKSQAGDQSKKVRALNFIQSYPLVVQHN